VSNELMHLHKTLTRIFLSQVITGCWR